MPPLPSVPNVLKVQVKGTYTSGYNWANVLHMSYSGGPPSDLDAETLATDIMDNYVSSFKALMPSGTIIKECIVTDLTSSTSAEGVAAGTNAGTRVGGSIGANSAMLISKLIRARYRGGHPRSYLPVGVTTDLLDEGHWTSAFVTSCQTAFEGFITECEGLTGGTTVIEAEVAVSYYTTDYSTTPHTRVRRLVPLVYPIESGGYTANPELASQRRRIGRKR